MLLKSGKTLVSDRGKKKVFVKGNRYHLRNRNFARVNQFMLMTVECLKVLFLYPKERGRYLTDIT
jgi:hypothetical protein